MAMNERPELSDDALKALLETRAGRASTDGLLTSVRLAAASTPQRRTGRFGRSGPFGLLRGSLGAGLAGATSLVLLVLALGIASGGHLPGVTTPSDRPSASGPASSLQSVQPPATPVVPAVAGPVLPLTVDQLNALMAADMNGLIGRRLVITGSLGTVEGTPVASCILVPSPAVAPAICNQRIVLVGSTPQLQITSIPADVSLAGLVTLSGVLLDSGRLEFEAMVTPSPTGGALLPSQLIHPIPAGPSGRYWLVTGWITGVTASLPCPRPAIPPATGPQYGCGRTAYLTDASFGVAADASNFGLGGPSLSAPLNALQVQNDAYQTFAPPPPAGASPQLAASGSDTGPLGQPRFGTFLVQAWTVACGPTQSCVQPAFNHWAIVARLDPWPEPAASATPAPSVESPAPSSGDMSAVRPLTVDELNTFMTMNSQSPSGRQLVITGTISLNMMAMLCKTPCTGWFLQGSDPNLWVNFDTYSGPRPLIPPEGLRLTFAATMGDGFVLDYQGQVSTTSDGGAFRPSQLPDPAAADAGTGDWLVQGWIVAGPLAVLCPQPPQSPYDGPQYTCAGLDILSDSEFLPSLSDPFAIPADGIRVQNGAYDKTAPAPSSTGAIALPEQATFLVRATANYHWQIVARVDPWPFPTTP